MVFNATINNLWLGVLDRNLRDKARLEVTKALVNDFSIYDQTCKKYGHFSKLSYAEIVLLFHCK
jgi:hypothetical protein